MESTQGVDEIIAALNAYGLDGYRASFYIDAAAGQDANLWVDDTLIREA